MKRRSDSIDALLCRVLRKMEADGVIWSSIDQNGDVLFHLTKVRPKPANPDSGNVTPLANAAHKRRYHGGS
jgi:hypothetical protein